MPDVDEEYEVDSGDLSSNNPGFGDQLSAAQLAAQDAADADQYSEENDQEEANKRQEEEEGNARVKAAEIRTGYYVPE